MKIPWRIAFCVGCATILRRQLRADRRRSTPWSRAKSNVLYDNFWIRFLGEQRVL
jgi:hypothetical protein